MSVTLIGIVAPYASANGHPWVPVFDVEPVGRETHLSAGYQIALPSISSWEKRR